MTRRAYILVFVLGVTTIVTGLALSYIGANGTVAQQAANRYAAVRAQYVAESGIALAEHYIHNPPSSVPSNGTYAGGTNIAIDDSLDTVDIVVTPMTPANHYSILATAVVRNDSGTEILAKKTLQCEAVIPPEPKWKIAQGLLLTGSATVSAGVTINGNVHANGNLIGLGKSTGAVTATGTALWTGGGPPTSVQSLRPTVSAPPTTSSLYSAYKVNHTAYSAYTGFGSSDLKVGDGPALTAAANASGNNPGRVVLLPVMDIKIKSDFVFMGTLVVRGKVEIDGDRITLQSVANYPALVVTGDILCSRDNSTVNVTGSVICGGTISDNGKNNNTLRINGAAIAQGMTRTGSNTAFIVDWNSTTSTFWDFGRTANPQPYTRLKWIEN